MNENPFEVPDIRRHTGRHVVIGLAIACVAYAALWYLPHHQIDAALDAADDCLSEVRETGSGDPSDCAPHMRFARALPWITSKRHMDRDEEIATLGVHLAATRDLDRQARDRYAEQIVTQSQWRDRDLFDLVQAGVFDVVAAHAADVPGDELRRGIQAALWTGNVDALAALAKIAPEPTSFDAAKLHLALVCLLGGDGHAATQLAANAVDTDRFNHAWRETHSKQEGGGYDPVEGDRQDVAALAQLCDPTPPAVTGDELGMTGWLALLAGRAPQPIRLDAPSELVVGRLDTLHALGDQAAADYVVDVYLPTQVSPSDVLVAERGFAPTPARDDDTARFIAGKADAEKSGDAAAQLHENAFALALHAAREWLRRGDAPHARSSLDFATQVLSSPKFPAAQVPRYRLQLVAYLVLAGDNAGALASADASHVPDKDDDTDRVLARTSVLLAEGKLQDAYDGLVKTTTDRYDLEGVGWLRAALALRLDAATPPELPPYEKYQSGTSATFYYDGARAAPERQAALRVADLPMFADTTVLPAALYLAGRMAGSGDVELWLDVVAATRLNDELDPIVYLSARAEAARWRGDEATAKRWDTRLAALRGLMTTDARAYLVHVLTNAR